MKKLVVAALFLNFLSCTYAQPSREEKQKTVDSLEFTLSRLRFHLDEDLKQQRKADSAAMAELEGTGIDSAMFWKACKDIRPEIWAQKQQLKHMDSMYYVMKKDLDRQKEALKLDYSLFPLWDSLHTDTSNITYNTQIPPVTLGTLWLGSNFKKDKPIIDTTEIRIMISNKSSGATRVVLGFIIRSRIPNTFELNQELVDRYYKPLKPEWEIWDWHYVNPKSTERSLYNFNAF